VNTIYVTAASAADINSLSSEIAKAVPGATVTTPSSLASEIPGSVTSAAKLGVSKTYGTGARAVRAVEGVDLIVADGEWVAIRGRTGHGKSTLLNLLGGQQQRVAIARALVKEPKVLLADEPTGNLDEDTRDEIIALMEKLWRERGLTLILVSHDGAVTRRAQRVALMSKGRLTIKS